MIEKYLLMAAGSREDAQQGWDISNASYDNVSLLVSGQLGFPAGCTFNPSGTSMYISGGSSPGIYQYTLTTAFDISTASYANKSLSITSTTTPRQCIFNNDGSVVYVAAQAQNRVEYYNLTTNYDISTASADSFFSVSSQGSNPRGIAFNNDGTKFYVHTRSNASIHEYALTTAYDLSTASFTATVAFSTVVPEPPMPSDGYGIMMSSVGDRMFIIDNDNDSVFQFDMTTNFDITTLTYNLVSFSVSSQTANPTILCFNADGTKMYSGGFINDRVYQYSL